uniref:radical SAM protein n=1 Tax=Treponema endosymbiont of Eucomonympha sp. TaxID=1580831 RepID=UPI000ADCAC5B
KAAGFRTIATNLEVWNEKLFDVICPGKSQLCGGKQNWLDALDEELRVFGRHRACTAFVSGIEPKESLLEGIETLLDKGAVVDVSQWDVGIGSPLEGHRTPAQDWHWDVFEKTAALYKKYGFTWDELRDGLCASNSVACDLFRLEAGIEAKEPAQARQTAA